MTEKTKAILVLAFLIGALVFVGVMVRYVAEAS